MNRRLKAESLLLFLLMIAGGLWHLFDLFQPLMRAAAGPLLTAVSCYLFIAFVSVQQNKQAALFWGFGVIIGGFVLESVGVHTGVPFGSYAYGAVLQPQIGGVPIAIGFAWLGILLSSLASAQMITGEKRALLIPVAALLMVAFDVLMEPAAVRLGYWNWSAGSPPWQNYSTWGVAALIFLQIGAALKLFDQKLPAVALHAFIAQLCYFLLVILKR